MFLNKKLLTIIGAAGLAFGAAACSSSSGGSVTGICDGDGTCGSITVETHYTGALSALNGALTAEAKAALHGTELLNGCVLINMTAELTDAGAVDAAADCATIEGSATVVGTCTVTVTFTGTEPADGAVIDSVSGDVVYYTGWVAADAKADCEGLDAGADYTTTGVWVAAAT